MITNEKYIEIAEKVAGYFGGGGMTDDETLSIVFMASILIALWMATNGLK